MLTRATRWFLIVAPVLAGVLLLILGTAGGISVAFGVSLIGIGGIVWMWNWFVRLSYLEYDRDLAIQERERARQQPAQERQARAQVADEPARPEPSPQRRAPVHQPARLRGRPPRRPQ